MSWSKKSDVVLNFYLEEKISLLANQLSFNIVITDGIRTPRMQVNRMYAKLNKTPPEDLTDVYANDEFANEVMDAYPDINAGIAVVKKYMAFSTPSKHLTGLGFDVRTTGGGQGAPGKLSSSQINLVIAAAEQLGFSPFLESDHLHIGVPAEKKNQLALVFILGVLIWISRKS
mgnify:CR=1 FL=1